MAPIGVRITVAGKRAQFSVQRQIHPGSWDAEKNRAKGNSNEANSNHKVIKVDRITKEIPGVSGTHLITAFTDKNPLGDLEIVLKNQTPS